MNSHIQDFIDYHELQLPKTDEAYVKDPRAFPIEEMWRDTIRRQLRLQDLKIYISTMHVNALDESEVITTLLIYGRGEPTTWDEIKILLGRSNAEATFSYTLKPLRDDEDFEWEHQGPPLALLKELCLGSDNDVEIRQQAEPGRRAVSKSPTPLLGQAQGGTGEPVVVDSAPDPEVNEPFDDEDQAEINAFLSGDGGVTERKPAIPQSETSSNDRALMLAQHDGIDVFTPEGLHEWQMKAMNAVAGQQPKLGKD